MNQNKTSALRRGEFAQIMAYTLRVGEIVLVRKDEVFPADLVLLSASGPVFMETRSLDGEQALKKRKLPRGFQVYEEPAEFLKQQKLVGMIETEPPNKDIYSLNAKMELNGTFFPLNVNQLLLKEAHLRNTEWIIGVVVYSGHETKVLMNSRKGKYKISSVETFINRTVVRVVVVQLAICLLLAMIGTIWRAKARHEHWYLEMEDSNALYFVKSLVTYFITLIYLIPMSMIVGMEVVKIAYAIEIRWDAWLYSFERGEFARVTNMSICEDMGQIEFLFSDKTGTLTKNEMKFSSAFIGELQYEAKSGAEKPEQGTLGEDLFFKTLALCHDCTATPSTNGRYTFQVSARRTEPAPGIFARRNMSAPVRTGQRLRLHR